MNTEYSDLPMLRDLLFNVGLDHVKRETNAYYSRFCKCQPGVLCIVLRRWTYKSLCCRLFRGFNWFCFCSTSFGAVNRVFAVGPSVSAAVVPVSASLRSRPANTAVSNPGQPCCASVSLMDLLGHHQNMLFRLRISSLFCADEAATPSTSQVTRGARTCKASRWVAHPSDMFGNILVLHPLQSVAASHPLAPVGTPLLRHVCGGSPHTTGMNALPPLLY